VATAGSAVAFFGAGVFFRSTTTSSAFFGSAAAFFGSLAVLAFGVSAASSIAPSTDPTSTLSPSLTP
jgi:hypothetical protein